MESRTEIVPVKMKGPNGQQVVIQVETAVRGEQRVSGHDLLFDDFTSVLGYYCF